MSDLLQRLELKADDLTAHCDPAKLPFKSTEELHPLDAVFGQERAVRAIEFALGMSARGYNLYASGPDGIGKSTIVESFLRGRAAQLPAPADWIYVYNFRDPDSPQGISLPPGEGRPFAEAVERAAEHAIDEIRQAFESDAYIRQRQQLAHGPEERRAKLIEELQAKARDLGFAIQMTPQGIASAPLVNGQPASEELFNALPQAQREEIQARGRQLEGEVQEALLKMRAVEREAVEQVEQVDDQVARFALAHLFEPLVERWGSNHEVVEFADGMREDLLKERDRLRGGQTPGFPMPGPTPEQQMQALRRRYEVNVIVTNDPAKGAPVIREDNPTYYNLIGRIEYVGQFGTMVTDQRLIKAGSLGRAHGGYLLVRVRDLLVNPPAYEGLKRALATGQLRIENLSEQFGLLPTSGLRPEPMPLATKVVIVGDGGLHSLLYRLDPDFRELFRVKADFEVDFERNDQTILGIASVIRVQCERAGLRCFTAEAIARCIEYSSRVVEDQRRLSANVSDLVDLVRQADFWASQDGAGMVEAKHVERALEEKKYRSSLIRDRIQRLIDEGTIFIDSAGEKVGQINALSVYDLGDIQFGRPSRITCVTSAGRGTIVNIERETNMAGPTHNKGFLILRGVLSERFGQRRALSLHASLTFEQLYGEIDGDSASSTELYVLLSSLADVPIKQSIAVTGSLNQRGEVQPIGGATEKIEGFYEVCRARGLDGTQGVMIPKSNVPNVVLKPEVARAIAEGRFHVWAVNTIEEGIEILTGTPAGERGEDGNYPEGTLFRLVEDRLDSFEKLLAGGVTAMAESATVMFPRVAPGRPPGIPPQPPPEPPIEVSAPNEGVPGGPGPDPA